MCRIPPSPLQSDPRNDTPRQREARRRIDDLKATFAAEGSYFDISRLIELSEEVDGLIREHFPETIQAAEGALVG